MESHSRPKVGKVIALASCILLAVSAFLVWGSILDVELLGTQGDGKYTLAIAVISFILILLKKVPLWPILVLGIASEAIGVLVFYGILDIEAGGMIDVGIGLYLTLIASLGLIVGVIVQMVKEKK